MGGRWRSCVLLSVDLGGHLGFFRVTGACADNSSSVKAQHGVIRMFRAGPAARESPREGIQEDSWPFGC